MSSDQSNGQRRRLLVVQLLVVLLTTPGFEVAVGTGESIEPRYQPCDLVLIDTTRDTVSAVHVHDTIACRSGSGSIGHEVVVITVDQDSVLARGVNRETRGPGYLRNAGRRGRGARGQVGRLLSYRVREPDVWAVVVPSGGVRVPWPINGRTSRVASPRAARAAPLRAMPRS